MKKLLLIGIAVASVSSLGMAAYFHFKKKQLWNPQPIKVSEPSDEEPVSQNIETPEEVRPASYIPSGIASSISQNQAAKEATPTPTPVTPIAPAEPKTIQSTIPSAKELTTSTTKNSGFVTSAIKPAAVKPALRAVKAPAVTAKPNKQVAPSPKTIVKATTKPTTRVLKPVQKASAVKRLSGDGWLEATADDMESRFYGTI